MVCGSSGRTALWSNSSAKYKRIVATYTQSRLTHGWEIYTRTSFLAVDFNAVSSLSPCAPIQENFFLLETLVTRHRLVRSTDDT